MINEKKTNIRILIYFLQSCLAQLNIFFLYVQPKVREQVINSYSYVLFSINGKTCVYRIAKNQQKGAY